MPIRMRGPDGQTVDIADADAAYYEQKGFAPISSEQEFREDVTAAAAPDDRGVIGSINAAATGFLSGLTVGGSDMLLGGLSTENQREQILEDRQANPGISTGSEIAGGLAASFAAPGSALAATPAGVLARAANTATGAARATTSGVKSLAAQAAITGAESAAQNVGSYLGSVALGDRKLTAEGLGGALGTGFAFGAAGGAAALGIEKGTIAARRMFSSVMDGGDDAAARAAGEWERRSKDLGDGNQANIEEARRRVDEAVRGRETARLDQQRAGAHLDEERLLATRARGERPIPDEAIPPLGGADVPTPAAAGPDPVRLKALADEADEAGRAFRARVEAMERRATAGGFDVDDAAAAAGRAVRDVEGAPVLARAADDGVPAPAPAAAAEDADDDLMAALLGTKKGIDGGVSLRHVAGAPPAAAAVPDDPLMRALMGTKAGLDEGATIGQLGARAKRGVEPIAPSAPPSQQAISDLDAFTLDAARYEKAVAELAEELGDGAAPATREAADALRKAETDAERQLFDRTANRLDDAADEPARALPPEAPPAPVGEVEGPVRLAPKERVRYAKERKLEATAAVSRARVAETEARTGLRAAEERGREIGQAADTIGLSAPGSAPGGGGGGVAGRAADIGAALEVAGMLGIQTPSVANIPVIGPVASLYLKYRALKGGAERLMGRVPATGNARAAAMASATKDKAARAIDHMLGLVERKAPAIRTAVAVAGPRLVEAVRERIFDDGEPPPGKDAGLQGHVAARSREIAALAADDALIAKQVRREMRDVDDPDLVNAAIEFRTAQIDYLEKVRPKAPPPSPFRREPWKPDKASATDFARRYAVAMDPVVALEQIEQRSLTPEAAEAFRAVYPLMFAQTQQRMLEQSTKMQATLPRAQLMRMSILFGLPLDESLAPEALARTQATFATPVEPAGPAGSAGAPPGPPAPSIAGPTDLASAYQTASDRRAAAR
jgi:hypothetical protein